MPPPETSLEPEALKNAQLPCVASPLRDLEEAEEGAAEIRRALFETVRPELPIDRYRDTILETVASSPTTIIQAETGAGKSTRVPQMLIDAGYRVVATQPRRLAARTVAQRVASEQHVPLGTTIGYRTAEDRQDSDATKVLYCTDGLQLVRELTEDGSTGGDTILVLDEVHEWNENIETLVAWARKRQAEGQSLRVVLMSATLDANALAEYFGGDSPVPVINVPGRMFPVTLEQRRADDLAHTVEDLARSGRNTLVFLPGKREIADLELQLRPALTGKAVVLPLHGDLTPEEQARCFQHYDLPKVVLSTNVAQTSVTIDDADAVVDSGLERRIELSDGIEGLYLREISRADCEQRRGRAGRCRPGRYILCSKTGLDDRQEFPTPEIQRTRIDHTVLRLAAAGIDATDLSFFHQPNRASLKEAKRALIALGALDASGAITPLGHRVARLPVDVHIGRMVVEAERHGCLPDVLTIAACLEVDGLQENKSNAWRTLTSERHADVLAQLDLYNAASTMRAEQMGVNGLFSKSVSRAREVRAHLVKALRRELDASPGGTADRTAILQSVIAGLVDHVYKNEGGTCTKPGDTRTLARESVVTNTSGWVVGLPRDIDVPQANGNRKTLHLLRMVSAVNPSWLVDIAPQLVHRRTTGMFWSVARGYVAEELHCTMNGHDLARETRPATTPDAVRMFADAIATGDVRDPSAQAIFMRARDVLREATGWWVRAAGSISKPTVRTTSRWIHARLPAGTSSVDALLHALENGLVTRDALVPPLDAFVSAEERARIASTAPLALTLGTAIIPLAYRQSDAHAHFQAEAAIPQSLLADLGDASVAPLAHHRLVLTCGGCTAPTLAKLRIAMDRAG